MKQALWLAGLMVGALVAPAIAAPGPDLFERKGCVGCHVLKGHPGATGTMGPELTKLYKAKPPRSVSELVAYLRRPHAEHPDSPAPRLALTEPEARALALYVLMPPASRSELPARR